MEQSDAYVAGLGRGVCEPYMNSRGGVIQYMFSWVFFPPLNECPDWGHYFNRSQSLIERLFTGKHVVYLVYNVAGSAGARLRQLVEIAVVWRLQKKHAICVSKKTLIKLILTNRRRSDYYLTPALLLVGVGTLSVSTY